jgi:hypothetical protein
VQLLVYQPQKLPSATSLSNNKYLVVIGIQKGNFKCNFRDNPPPPNNIIVNLYNKKIDFINGLYKTSLPHNPWTDKKLIFPKI